MAWFTLTLPTEESARKTCDWISQEKKDLVAWGHIAQSDFMGVQMQHESMRICRRTQGVLDGRSPSFANVEKMNELLSARSLNGSPCLSQYAQSVVSHGDSECSQSGGLSSDMAASTRYALHANGRQRIPERGQAFCICAMS
jgi:hypothetical protein